jgi:hypothetical protein
MAGTIACMYELLEALVEAIKASDPRLSEKNLVKTIDAYHDDFSGRFPLGDRGTVADAAIASRHVDRCILPTRCEIKTAWCHPACGSETGG